MRLDHLGILHHHAAHLLRNRPYLHRVGTDDAELHRKSDGRAEHEPVHAGARFRHGAVRDRPVEPRLEALASIEVAGDDHDLGEVRVRQRRIQS